MAAICLWLDVLIRQYMEDLLAHLCCGWYARNVDVNFTRLATLRVFRIEWDIAMIYYMFSSHLYSITM